MRERIGVPPPGYEIVTQRDDGNAIAEVCPLTTNPTQDSANHLLSRLNKPAASSVLEIGDMPSDAPPKHPEITPSFSALSSSPTATVEYLPGAYDADDDNH